jgi:cell division septal protein FtsQ
MLFLHSPFSRVEKIEIQGNQFLSDREVMKRIGAIQGMSFFHFNAEKAKSILEKLPVIKQVRVNQLFPSKLYIQVQEYPVVALWRTKDGKLQPLLENGVKVPMKKNFHSSKPILDGWDSLNATAILTIKQLSTLPRELQQEIVWIQPAPHLPDQIILRSTRQHDIFVRVHELHQKLKLYSAFRNHPSGTIYLLESIWFTPKKMTKNKM